MRVYLIPVQSLSPNQFPMWKNNLELLQNTINGLLDDSNVRPGGLSGQSLSSWAVGLGHLKPNTLSWDADYLVLPYGASVDASTTGLKNFDGSVFVTPNLRHVKGAILALEYDWTGSSQGTIQLFDVTANRVLGETSAKTGPLGADWEEIDVTNLVGGNTIRLRANITTAASGSTVTVYKAVLRLTMGAS